jgi:superfamily II DNA or RNA helicase
MTTLYSQGIKYEKYIQDMIKSNYQECWLWDEVPNDYKIKLGLINCDIKCDIGYDIVCLNNDNTYTYIQCKNFTTTGINNTIQIEDLAGFYNFVAENLIKNAIVYYSGNLSKQILIRKNNIQYINMQYVKMNNTTISPRDYQLEAFSTLETVKRSVLEMPCGTGKTLVTYLIANKYDNIILLSPLIATTDQLVIHYTNYYGVEMSKFNCTVIHSQNTRNLESITLGDKNILGATFESCDIINKLLNKLKGSIFVVIDECHNLTNSMISDSNNAINNLLNSKYNILFVSATPNNYKGFENIFGTARYTLGWDKAIENKYICDFNFYYPNSEKIINYIDEIKFDKTIIEKTKLIYKAFFLLESIKSLDIKKCIVYLKNIDEVKHFKNILGLLNVYFELVYNINLVTGDSTKKERDVAITKFRNRLTNICILLNVYVLDEGIDIPECDSVYLTNPNNNPTSIIQRISRANRLCEGKTVAKVLVWGKDELKIKDILKNIGSYVKIKCGNVTSKFLNNHDKVNDHNISDQNVNEYDKVNKYDSVNDQDNVNKCASVNDQDKVNKINTQQSNTMNDSKKDNTQSIHNNKKETVFNCPCGKSFSKSYLLNRHQTAKRTCSYITQQKLNNSKNNDVICDICNKKICDKYKLKRHKISCQKKHDKNNIPSQVINQVTTKKFTSFNTECIDEFRNILTDSKTEAFDKVNKIIEKINKL